MAPLVAQKAAPAGQKFFSISIQAPVDAELSEIEFSDTDLSGVTDAEAIGAAKTKTIRTKGKQLRLALAPELKYFRVRSIHKTGVAGTFSKTLLVENFLRKAYREPVIPIVQHGQTEYLQGSRIELQQQPNLVTRYRIADGEFQEYREPIVFNKAGTYRLQVLLENAEKQAVFTRNYVFKVELNPPATKAVIADPVHSRRGVGMGKNSSLVFLTEDNESGVTQIFYRVVPLGKDAATTPFAEYGRRLTHADFSAHGGTSLLQFYSIDKAGNKEETKTEIIFCE